MKKKRFQQGTIAALGAAVWICSSATNVFASDNSVTVLPAEGNVVCADYASNKVILSMDTRSPETMGELTGPENPADGDRSGESATYEITDNGTRLSFADSTTPIDYAVLKSGKNVSIIMYESGGITDDGNMTVTTNGRDRTISAFSLCYGLGNEPLPPSPPPQETSKICTLGNNSLDATGVVCPTNGTRALVCNFEIGKDFFGTNDDSDVCCVCDPYAIDPDPVPECDAGLAAGIEGSCLDLKDTNKGTEVETHLEINNDPYYCITRSGKRKCYKY